MQPLGEKLASIRKVAPMVTQKECLERFPTLNTSTTKTGWEHADSQFPIRITRSWANRIQSLSDPLAKQVFPQPSEMTQLRFTDALENPVGEKDKIPVPFVVQKHENRALLLVSRKCHLHCRYCFRRTLDDLVEPTEAELNIAIDYLLNSGVEEVILSGGDPLFLNNDRLQQILERLHSIPTIRIHTRAPITFPSRVNEGLIRTLSVHSNIWIIVHCNHSQELNDEVKHGLKWIRNAGIPLLNQSVLLKGVNDDASILAELSRTLVRIGIFPYYLHHTDRVQGAEDFFVSLQDGMALYQELEQRISGIALPKYVIDLPDGSGKIPVNRYINRLNLLQK